MTALAEPQQPKVSFRAQPNMLARKEDLGKKKWLVLWIKQPILRVEVSTPTANTKEKEGRLRSMAIENTATTIHAAETSLSCGPNKGNVLTAEVAELAVQNTENAQEEAEIADQIALNTIEIVRSQTIAKEPRNKASIFATQVVSIMVLIVPTTHQRDDMDQAATFPINMNPEPKSTIVHPTDCRMRMVNYGSANGMMRACKWKE
jgi:hypothetical protein